MNNLNREEIKTIVDDLHAQIVIIKMCMDSIEALQKIGNEKIHTKNADNFFRITYNSLIFRYEMELCKLVCDNSGMNIKTICNKISENSSLFFDSNTVIQICRDIKKTVTQKYKAVNKNLWERRNKSLAHNDNEFFFYSERIVETFPLNYDIIKDEVDYLYHCSKYLQRQIFSDVHYYPKESNDVKNLFE